MPNDNDPKAVIEQLTITDKLLRTETRDGVTEVKKASKVLGDFERSANAITARAYVTTGVVKASCESEDAAIEWIVAAHD
jgi:hypothetical protein